MGARTGLTSLGRTSQPGEGNTMPPVNASSSCPPSLSDGGLSAPVWCSRSPSIVGHAARVTLDWDELLAVSEERLHVDNLAREVNRATADLAADAREVLAYAESILRHPQTAVYAARAEVDGESVLAVGLALGLTGWWSWTPPPQ